MVTGKTTTKKQGVTTGWTLVKDKMPAGERVIAWQHYPRPYVETENDS